MTRKSVFEPIAIIAISSAILFTVSVVWYVIDGGLIELGGDAVGRWADLINWSIDGVPPELDHHALRWGLNAPILLLIAVSGSAHPAVYHLIMPIFGAISAVFIYLTIRYGTPRLTKEISFCFVVFAIMAMEFNERPFSQLLPIGAAVCYMCATLAFLKRAFNKETKQSGSWFLLAGLTCFCAYGAKLTMVWFGLPLSAFLLVTAIKNGQVFKVWPFFLPLLLGLLVETVLLYQGTGSILGRALHLFSAESRYGLNLQNFLNADPNANLHAWGFATFGEYVLESPLKYFEGLGYYSFVIYFTISLITFQLLRKPAKVTDDQFERCLWWTILGFFLLQTYAVVGVAPYIFPERYIHGRYQYPLLMLCLIFLSYKFVRLLGQESITNIRNGNAVLPICSVLLLLMSLLFFTNHIFSKHNNLGIAVTLMDNRVLTRWLDQEGNVGYLAPRERDGSPEGLRLAIEDSPNAWEIRSYVKSLYRRSYCSLKEAYIYVDTDYVYGLCAHWKPNEMIMFYYVTSLEFMRPTELKLQGKYADLPGARRRQSTF